jgi:hypothetical protein
VSAWLSYAGGSPRQLFAGADNDAQQDYLFEIAFDMGAFNPLDAHITNPRFAADNQMYEIAVNGVPVFSATAGSSTNEFVAWQPLPVELGRGLFVPGMNSVTFRVFNSPGGPSPMGFRFEGNVVVPEPGSIISFATVAALFCLVLFARSLRGRGNQTVRIAVSFISNSATGVPPDSR